MIICIIDDWKISLKLLGFQNVVAVVKMVILIFVFVVLSTQS